MSEYQYYEFAAVDQQLTEQAQSELRSRSTRATITASCFINEYHWGNLKGEPLDWVERFFELMSIPRVGEIAACYSVSHGTSSTRRSYSTVSTPRVTRRVLPCRRLSR